MYQDGVRNTNSETSNYVVGNESGFKTSTKLKEGKSLKEKKNSLYKDVDLWEIICEIDFCAILCDK